MTNKKGKGKFHVQALPWDEDREVWVRARRTVGLTGMRRAQETLRLRLAYADLALPSWRRRTRPNQSSIGHVVMHAPISGQ